MRKRGHEQGISILPSTQRVQTKEQNGSLRFARRVFFFVWNQGSVGERTVSSPVDGWRQL